MKRNKFNLSHFRLLTCNMGNLVPIMVKEALPGDSWRMMSALLARIQRLNHPLMHPVRIRVHTFFVPYTEIWDDFEDFITKGEDGTSTPTHPVIDMQGTVAQSTLADYLGIPPATYGSTFNVNALPFRAYALIWNEFFRDQQIVTKAVIDTTSGADTTTNTALKPVMWSKDRLTTARSSTQLGSTVTIPLGDTARIYGANMDFDSNEDSGNIVQVRDAAGGSANLRLLEPGTNKVHGGSASDGTGELLVDLAQATGVDIDDLRLAMATQKFRERMNSFGSRYVEYLRYIGVRGMGRVNKADLLNVGSKLVAFSEVLSTDGANTGTMYGHGLGAMRTRRFIKYFREHGLVMSFISTVPLPMYMQGLERMWKRSVQEDYFQHEFQHIGDQDVLNSEVYTEHTSPDGTFGYAPRYDSYRYAKSSIHGEFRSTRNTWHMARDFGSDPALNSSFIQCSPTTRVYASTTTDQMLIEVHHRIQARRMMAKYAVPRLIG